ncbi:isopeptide-forming domain-containing fimbrial protein [Lysinibacillus telephonicus]
MALQIGSTDIPLEDLPVIQEISDGNSEWGYYSGTYTVPAGQTTTRFAFKSISAEGGNQRFGNLLDDIFLGTEPCVVAEKTVSPQGEVHPGDELTYEITAKNNGGDIAANAIFEDAIPAGTEYVPGSLKITNGPGAGDLTDAQDADAGYFDAENNKIIVTLGDLPNTGTLPNGVTVQFKVKALVSDTISEIRNQAQINYDNLLTNENEQIDSNETTTSLTMLNPVLDSKKTSTILEKADGNTDTEHPEVGDTLLYTISTQNTVANSIVKNMVISDKLPEGLEYVPGTLEVDGVGVSDAEDGDKGHFVDGIFTGEFGDILDTSAHTIEFQVKVGAGQAGKDIINTATISGDNLLVPSNPQTVVKVYPRLPVLESVKTVSNLEEGKVTYEVGDTVVYTIKTRNTVSEGEVKNLTISDTLPEGLEYVAGSLKVDGQTATDNQGDDKGYVDNNTVVGEFGNVTDTEWHTVEFKATIASGQSQNTIQNIATADGDNIDQPDTAEETVKVDPKKPNLFSKKTASISEKAEGNTDVEHPEVGDTLLYKITTQNTVEESLVQNLVISDKLPEGLEYVPGTLKVDGVLVSDEEDEDEGYFVDGTFTGQIGNVTDTNEHTLEFLVKVAAGQAGKDILNIATISSDNVDEPSNPQTEVKVYPRFPVLESVKTAENLVEGKATYEVGDTIVYTIKTRNTVSEGVVENLTISDTLPEGLEYVAGSLKVDGQPATDAKDEDSGHFENNVIIGQFGDVTDTEWHSVTFEAKVLTGQFGKTLTNTAVVDGDNIDKPNNPTTEVQIENEPKDPEQPGNDNNNHGGGGGGNGSNPPPPTEEGTNAGELNSTKAVFDANGNSINGQKVKVGDQLIYKITIENVKNVTTIVNNVKVIDDIPAGLSYVPGTLTVNGQVKADDAVNGQVITVDDIGSLKGGEKVEVAFKVVVTEDAQGEITNVAKVEGTVPGKNSGDPDQSIVPQHPETEIYVPAAIQLTKTVDQEVAHVGDIVTYTIEVKNGEAGGVWNGVIEDQLSAHLELVANSTKMNGEALDHSDVWSNGQLTINPVTLKAGEKVTVTFQAKILGSALNKTVENIAVVYDLDQPSDSITTPPTKTEVVPVGSGGNSNGEGKDQNQNNDGSTKGEGNITDKEEEISTGNEEAGSNPSSPEVEGSSKATKEEEEQQKLPQTGQEQTRSMMMIGLLMIAIALFGLFKRKRTLTK